MKKLILIGLPGSGKTTVGGLLARQLGLPFRDCDPQVERLAERTVAQLFSSGELLHCPGLSQHSSYSLQSCQYREPSQER